MYCSTVHKLVAKCDKEMQPLSLQFRQFYKEKITCTGNAILMGEQILQICNIQYILHVYSSFEGSELGHL